MAEKITTESESNFDHLELMSVHELLRGINSEDKKVAIAVEKSIPQVKTLVDEIVPRMKKGGRLFYIGAGTSGRLGVVDASECPPTFGVSDDLVIGLIAGGDKAIRKAVEFSEDDVNQGWLDVKEFTPGLYDSIIGIAASGNTPYVIGAVKKAKEEGLLTGCITCNNYTKLAASVDYPIEAIVGAEFITGSTRMKAGTAQKLLLNMISTSIMIKLGRVQGNKMVDMQLSNHKLLKRGERMIVDELGVSMEEAEQLLKEKGSVRGVLNDYRASS